MMEYAAKASCTLMISLRSGRWKFNRCSIDQDQLFDLELDLNELNNLAASPEHQAVIAQLCAEVNARWDLPAFDAAVCQSQACRRVVYDALTQGGYYP